MKKKNTFFCLALILILGFLCIYKPISRSQGVEDKGDRALNFSKELKLDEINNFMTLLLSRDKKEISTKLEEIRKSWHPAYIPITLEIFNFLTSDVAADLLFQLKEHTGKDFQYDINAWFKWLWNQENYGSIENYDNFKAIFYKAIDPRFETYFLNRNKTALIRLDEIRWGGVKQDGIPPLRNPKMITADEANFLEDDNIIFGIEVNGDVRAYPKRILAWHEMFVDTVGGIPVAGVYCTLCGAVILYETKHKGVDYNIGTSGFLYRSNKLMYDKKTQSLWNTITGEPVLGPLANKGVILTHRSIVTTTWGAWKKNHPNTKVLSIDTGHDRNYGEGVAYRKYFDTDKLMFNTPFSNKALKNKDEVLALRFQAHPKEQLAISIQFLNKNKIYYDKIGKQKFVVLTDQSGANRVYDPKTIEIVEIKNNYAIDREGQSWSIQESQLLAEDGRSLERLPYHRAFWFGWYAMFPETRLIK